MSISFDNALGIHDDALLLRARRAEVLANNIANADTPNFKARDIDFKAILNGEMEQPIQMAVTDASHQPGLASPDMAAELMYRIPHQASVDGNTVEVNQEMASYTDNSLAYESSFTFLDKKFQGLIKALKAE
ncbi:flagellar basal body rod protein FlgB [Marinobacterium jannaschii]|uniref:flagellar basal body rod protein FlgB n=1 Tax=Marinobacterium jannaschii TaxID=64970 RepID=UPI0004821C77|nr:flagellar basal body rod protein FlgB [Marinobacterium jannaschii]